LVKRPNFCHSVIPALAEILELQQVINAQRSATEGFGTVVEGIIPWPLQLKIAISAGFR